MWYFMSQFLRYVILQYFWYINLVKNIKIIIFCLIVFYSKSLFSDECKGYVVDLYIDIDGGVFTGKCNDNGEREWGLTEYTGEFEGHYYQGFYSNDRRSYGTYRWPNGDYKTGNFLGSKNAKDRNNGIDYDFFGHAYFAESQNEYYGYTSDDNQGGFTVFLWKNDSSGLKRTMEAGVVSNNYLNGYGVRAADSIEYYGFWEEGAVVGDYYSLDDDENLYKYIKQKNGDTLGPYVLNTSDTKRYGLIKNFVDTKIDEVLGNWELIEKKIDQYDAIVESVINKEDEIISNNIEKNTENFDLISSIQELLIELNFSPGEPDGILGKRTISAIKAFQVAYELEMTGEADEDLLVYLQLALKNLSNDKNLEIDPKFIGSGTGFYINNNNMVTNFHVISKCEYITDSFDNKLELINQDQVNDLAILKGNFNENFLSVSRNAPVLGEKVYVAGFPYNNTLKGFNFTTGNVSSLIGLGQDVANFQITAPVQPGNSGGPILNEYGSVVGVTVARINDETIIEETNSIPQNINFGIKNTILKSLLSDNKIQYQDSDSFFKKSQKNIASISRDSSALIKCYGFDNE